MNLYNRLRALRGNLKEYSVGDPIPLETGRTFNVLLEEAKKSVAGDPVVSQIEPVGLDGELYADAYAGSLRGSVDQILLAISDD